MQTVTFAFYLLALVSALVFAFSGTIGGFIADRLPVPGKGDLPIPSAAPTQGKRRVRGVDGILRPDTRTEREVLEIRRLRDTARRERQRQQMQVRQALVSDSTAPESRANRMTWNGGL